MCYREVVAEFLDMSNGDHFGVSGEKDQSGRLVLDLAARFVGPFLIFEDGTVAKFLRIASWKLLKTA